MHPFVNSELSYAREELKQALNRFEVFKDESDCRIQTNNIEINDVSTDDESENNNECDIDDNEYYKVKNE